MDNQDIQHMIEDMYGMSLVSSSTSRNGAIHNHYVPRGHGSHHHRSRHHGSRHHDEYRHENGDVAIHHHHYYPPRIRYDDEIERADYEQDRGDYYRSAYEEERDQRHYDNRNAHRAQRDHYNQGYLDGYEDTHESSGRAVRRQARQYEQAREEDQRRYYQNVNDAYAHGREQGEQEPRRSTKKTPRQPSPNNHSRRLTYQDRNGNDAAFRHGNQWHGYAETEYDD